MLPIIIKIYSRVIKKDIRISAFIYLTMLTLIAFITEIARTGHGCLIVTILITIILKVIFTKDVELIVRNGKLKNYDNIAMIPIFGYMVVTCLAMLWNTSPKGNSAVEMSFSLLALTFCVFVFTTYKYAFRNYIKKLEILEQIEEKKNILEIQNKTQKDIILSLAEITEAKSGQTGKHVKRVSEYSRVLASALNFSVADVEKIRVASMMQRKK